MLLESPIPIGVTADEKAALTGTSGTPSSSNKYVTNADPRNSDARVPTAHALGGSEHNASTLAQLNAKISDATLDTNTASRPPSGTASGSLGGTYPSPTVNDGADGSAIHRNIASEISTATEKTVPTSADLLLIEDSAATNAKRKLQIGNLPRTKAGVQFHPNDAIIPAFGPAATVRNGRPVLAFDDTGNEECHFEGVMPRGYKGGDLKTTLMWAAASAVTGDVRWTVTFERLAENDDDIDADYWGLNYPVISTTPAVAGYQRYSVVQTTASQSENIAAGEAFRMRVRRTPSIVTDTMVGDAHLLRVLLEEV